MGRLELPRVSPLEPKSSASTNSATFAAIVLLQYSAIRCGSSRKGPRITEMESAWKVRNRRRRTVSLRPFDTGRNGGPWRGRTSDPLIKSRGHTTRRNRGQLMAIIISGSYKGNNKAQLCNLLGALSQICPTKIKTPPGRRGRVAIRYGDQSARFRLKPCS